MRRSAGVPIVASLIKRGPIYYLQYGIGGQARRISTSTDSDQLVEEKHPPGR